MGTLTEEEHAFVESQKGMLNAAPRSNTPPRDARKLLAIIDRLSLQAPAEPKPDDETGWVIEHGGSEKPVYWIGRNRWDSDHLKAIRFAREQDAFNMSLNIENHGAPHRVVHHAWNMKPTAPIHVEAQTEVGDYSEADFKTELETSISASASKVGYAWPPSMIASFLESMWEGHACWMVRQVLRTQALADWQPIEQADKTSEILVHVWGGWHIARWVDDRHAQKPRPFWRMNGLDVSSSRAHQPTRFIALFTPPSPKASSKEDR